MTTDHDTTQDGSDNPAGQDRLMEGQEMNGFLLSLGRRWHVAVDRATTTLAHNARTAWDERADEDGVDEAVSKMIWLAVGVGVAVVATTFFLGIFEAAKAGVPDPVAPTP